MLVISEKGIFEELPQAVATSHKSHYSVAQALYKGSGKKWFQSVAEQLDIPTTETKYNSKGEPCGEKDLTMEALKEEILMNVGDTTLLVLPDSKRLTTGIRYWLEDAINEGVRVCCFAAANPGKDVFLEMLEIELEVPGDRAIRRVMETEAEAQGMALTRSELAQLQPLAGRNPMLARKVIRNHKLGLTQKAKPEHTQYIVMMPVIIALLMSLGIVRFIGMGTRNKNMYLFGGIALTAGMAMKQVGQVRGARKRLGQ